MGGLASFLNIPFFLSTTILVLVFLLMIIKQQRKSMSSKHGQQANYKLPPGSLGFPIIGETLELFSQSPREFFDTRQNRYGEIFKTNILGCSCIMMASPESARFVLVTKASLFRPTYPKGKERLIGPSAIFFQQGTYHTQIRKLVQPSLSLGSIKRLVPQMEAAAVSTLDSWSDRHLVHTFHELKKYAFDVAVLSIFGELNNQQKEKLERNYCILDKGYNSFPIVMPGTSYYRSLLARRRLGRLIGEIINERRERRLAPINLLGHFLHFNDENGNAALTDNQISDNIIGVLFAAQDTTASLLTWIIKYLSDDKKLLEAIKEEQRAIYISNDRGRLPLTWDQTREMPTTHKVILESLRMASIIAFTYREATQDVVYDGYLIPKGWKVLPLFRNIHHNPTFFADPHIFDPSRFEVGTSKAHTFMPFGYGAHSCPGNELAKLEMFVFIYHLVNNFRWDLIGPSTGVHYNPFPVPENGLSAKFWKTTCGPGEHACLPLRST